MSDEATDTIAPLGAFKNRRASLLLTEKLVQKWAEKDNTESLPEEPEDNSLIKKTSGKSVLAVPKMVDLDDMQEVLFECINEESLRREAMENVAPPVKGLRRGSVQVIRPESSSVVQEAEVLGWFAGCRILVRTLQCTSKFHLRGI